MDDGLYRLEYAGVSYAALGLFAMREGAFTGVGQAGAKYTGTCTFEAARNLYVFEGRAQFPPNTPMVFGPVSPNVPITIPFRGETAKPAPRSRFSLDFAGRSVDVAMTWVGPLPAGADHLPAQ